MTTLTYNHVEMRNVRTLIFAQECEYDAEQLLHHNYRLRVEGLVHADAASETVVTTGASPASAPEAAAAIRARLMQPGKPLHYQVGGTTLLEAGGTGARQTQDTASGPHPIALEVTHFAGAALLRVEFEIRVTLPPEAAAAGSLSNGRHAFTLEETRDENFRATRRWQGKLHFRESVAPDSTPKPPPPAAGFRREKSQYVLAADGRSLSYLIVDRQQHAAPPPPATNWEATYRQTRKPADAAGEAEIAVKLEGPAQGNRRDLLVAAAGVVAARLGDLRVGGVGGAVLKQAELIEPLHENHVELRVTAIRLPGGPTYLGLDVEGVGAELNLPGYDPTQFSAVAPGESTSPLTIPIDPAAGTLDAVELYESQGELPLDPLPASSAAHSSHPYTRYEVENRFEIDNGQRQVPYCGQDDNSLAPTAAVIAVHAPLAKRILRLQAERIGEWPEPPEASASSPGGITETLLEQEVRRDPPELLPDGVTRLFRLELKQVYALSRPPTLAEQASATA